jgi:hypothetical protein
MGVPSVGGVKMTLQAGHVHLPLQALKERMATDGAALRPPRIGAPKVADEFELKPIRDIALRELLSHATHGTARVHLPLVATKLKKGLFTIEIPEEAEAVIELEVEDGIIIRDKKRTRGDIVPDISLPLGLKFRGIYLDDDGSIIADIARFPNLNLSWLNVAKLRIPATLEELMAMLFGDEIAGEPSAEPEPKKDGTSVPVDLSRLRVEARDIVPRPDGLPLGQAGVLQLGPDTRLDVDYTEDALELGGHVDISRADLTGAGFAVRGLSANGTGSGAVMRTDESRRVVMEFRCHEVSVSSASIELLDGSRLEFGESYAEDVDVVFTRTGGEVHFHVAARQFRGRLTSGVLMTWIGRKVHPVRLSEMDLEGAITISDQHFEVDVEVQGARLELDDFALPLGVAYLDVATLEASGTGRLIAGSQSGYSFAGSLAVNADLKGGKLLTGPLSARLVEGTHVTLAVSRIGGAEHLQEIDASGTVDFRIASGSIPIGAHSRLKFARGAVGTLALHQLALERGDAWPKIEAGAQFTAASDPFDLEDLMELPPGVMSVEIPHIGLEADGDLALRDIVIVLASEE